MGWSAEQAAGAYVNPLLLHEREVLLMQTVNLRQALGEPRVLVDTRLGCKLLEVRAQHDLVVLNLSIQMEGGVRKSMGVEDGLSMLANLAEEQGRPHAYRRAVYLHIPRITSRVILASRRTSCSRCSVIQSSSTPFFWSFSTKMASRWSSTAEIWRALT